MKTVVLTRQTEDNVSLKKLLCRKELSEKIQVREFACLRVVSHAPLQEQIDVLAKIFSTELLSSKKIIFFLASQKAWMAFYSWLQEQLPSTHPHSSIKKFLTDSLLSAVFVAVGKKTAEAIQQDGFSVALTENYAETLSEQIVKEFSAQDYVILKPRGNLSRTTGEDFLQEQNFQMYSLTIYTNKEVFPPPLDFYPHGVVFYSPSAVRRFFQNNPPQNFVLPRVSQIEKADKEVENHPEKLQEFKEEKQAKQKQPTTFFSIGATTARELKRLGLPSFSPNEMTDTAMASLIEEKLF